MSSTLVVDTSLQATQQASDFSVLGFKSILPTSTNTPEELTIDTFRDGVRPLLLANPLVDILAPGDAEKFLTNGTLTTDRATIGTRVNKTTKLVETLAIDTIREEAEGFLIEGVSTNPILWSEELDNVAWIKSNISITPNSDTAPDGALSADKLIATAVDQVHIITSSVFNIVSGGDYTFSEYVKSDGLTRLRIDVGGGGNFTIPNVEFNLTNVTAGAGGTIEAVGDYFRITLATQATATTTSSLKLVLQDDAGNITFLGNGVDGVFAWGAQVEQLPFASSYIKTTTTAATRAADDVKFLISGNVLTLPEISFLYTLNRIGDTGVNQFAFSSGAAGASDTFSNIDGNVLVGYTDSSLDSGELVVNGLVTKVAATYKSGDSNLYINSILKDTDTATITTALTGTDIHIGSNSSNLDNAFFHALDFMIFERALNQLEIVTIESGAALPATNSSEEDPLFPFVNTLDFRDNTKYSPLVTSGTVVIEFNQSVVQPIDYFAFAIHNSQDAGLTGKLEVDSGAGFEIVAEFASVKNNRPFLKFFGTKNTQRQKLTLNFNSKLFIGTIFLGEAVTFDRTPSLGFQPGRTAPLDTVEQFTTDGNNFIIGRRINRGFNEKSTFRFVKFDDIDLFYEDFQNHVLDSKSVFFKWSNTKNQTIFGLQNARTMTKPQYATSFHSDISFDISGYS